jgi:hypothetical protein
MNKTIDDILIDCWNAPWFIAVVEEFRSNLTQHATKLFEGPAIFVFTFAYFLIAFIGISGNILTIYVIARSPRLRRKSITMLFLCNLATSDLLLLVVGVPNDILYLWNKEMSYPGGWMGMPACLLKGKYIVQLCELPTCCSDTHWHSNKCVHPYNSRDGVRNLYCCVPSIYNATGMRSEKLSCKCII